MQWFCRWCTSLNLPGQPETDSWQIVVLKTRQSPAPSPPSCCNVECLTLGRLLFQMNLEKCLSRSLTGTSAAVNRYQSLKNIHCDYLNSTAEVKGEQAPFALYLFFFFLYLYIFFFFLYLYIYIFFLYFYIYIFSFYIYIYIFLCIFYLSVYN